jgi:hypothetical protein
MIAYISLCNLHESAVLSRYFCVEMLSKYVFLVLTMRHFSLVASRYFSLVASPPADKKMKAAKK